MTATTTTLDERTAPATDQGDHDRMAHIVHPPEAGEAAMVAGTPCTALCGKTWVPVGFGDQAPYPECPTCNEAWVRMWAR